MSTVAFQGTLRSGWRLVPIKSLARSGGKTFTDGDWIETPYITDAGVRLIQTGNIGLGKYREQGFRYVSPKTFRVLRCTEINPGDVLICRLADPVGRACLAPELGVPMITSVDVVILKASQDVDPRFVRHALTSTNYLEFVASITRGGTRQRISRSMLGSIQIPIPPYSRQRRIADFLDRKTAAIDALIAKKERLIELLEEKRQALITQAVTKGLDPNVPMKDSGIEWLGEIPAHWRISTVGREGRFIPGTGFPHEYQGLEHEALPFFKVGDMSHPGNAVCLERSAHSVSWATAKALRARVCPADAIAFAKVGAALLLNKRRRTVYPCIFDNNMMAFDPYSAEPEYVRLFLRLVDFGQLANPGPVPSVTGTAIGQAPLILPPASEQEEIRSACNEIQEHFDLLLRSSKAQVAKLYEYRQALITAAVTGQLDVSEAS